jgi:hypothetical protein
MHREELANWLERYVQAWKTYNPQAIGDLFSEDAEYRYQPWDEPVRGRDAIVASWLEPDRLDAPGSWEASYEPVAVEGNSAVASGRSVYYREGTTDIEREYHNVFIMRFHANGKCSSFTEYYMKKPDTQE